MRPAALALALTALGVLAMPARAQLSANHQQWAAGPASFLFTDADREAWKAVATDADAMAFERLFWARRDATPETPANEFQADFEARVAAADANFGDDTIRGAMSERGRVLILLGKPSRITRQTSDRVAGATTADGDDFGTPATFSGGGQGGGSEIWAYEKDTLPAGSKRLMIHFRSEPGYGSGVMVRDKAVLKALDTAAASTVTRPGLTLADLAPAPAPVPVVAAPAEPPAAERAWQAEALADEPLRAALAGDLATVQTAFAADLDVAAFQAVDGVWEVEVQVMARDRRSETLDLVGLVRDVSGATKLAFRHAQPWRESAGRSYQAQSLILPAGSYDLRVGLVGADGKLAWAAGRAVEVLASSDLWLSQLVVAEDILPLEKGQQMYDPWAWNGVLVVPKGGGLFASGAGLWYYLHACNPMLGPDGNPSLKVVVEFIGAKKLRGPADLLPVKASERCFVLAQAYDLLPGTFPPGKYVIKVQVTDALASKTLTAQGAFEIVPGPSVAPVAAP